MTLLASPLAPLVVGVVSGTLVAALAAWVLRSFYYRNGVPVKMDRGRATRSFFEVVSSKVQSTGAAISARSAVKKSTRAAAGKNDQESSRFDEIVDQATPEVEAFSPQEPVAELEESTGNLPVTEQEPIAQAEAEPEFAPVSADELRQERSGEPVLRAELDDLEPATPVAADAQVSRQDAIRARRARAARKQSSRSSAPAVGFIASSGRVAASIYRPRHMHSEDWGKGGGIRVRQDQYWDSEEPVSPSRIQESMRQAKSYADEAYEYVSSIAIRGTADDSIVQRRINLQDTSTGVLATHDEPARDELEERIRSRAVASAISTRVAYVDEGVFPEKRTFDDLEKQDDWELALSAMEEKLMSRTPAYYDVSAPEGYLRVLEGGAYHEERIDRAKHFSAVGEG